MLFEDLIDKINQSADKLDFVTTRQYIESNYEQLEEKKHLLNTNARDILEFVLERINLGLTPISKPELATINTVNMYARNFNLNGIKLAVSRNSQLFMRSDITDYLNKDAKVLLEGMGIIEK